MRACIGIPIYKEKLDPLEVKSFNRLFKIDKKHIKYIITHKNLNLGFYRAYFEKFENLRIVFFDKFYFTSIESYNKLLLSSSFYSAFIDFDYLLIYQLDALILKDELDFWCSKGYDYLGAPWFDFERKYDFYTKLRCSKNPIRRWIKKKIDFNKGNFILVGNGGYSLRKIRSFKKIAKWLPIIEPNLLKYKINEDVVWSILVPKYFGSFKIPDVSEAFYFSIETNQHYALNQINNNLPFGCHGWNEDNFVFWEKVLKSKGIDI